MKGLLLLFLLVLVPSRPAMIIGKRSINVDTNKKCVTSPGYPNKYPDNSHTKQTISVAGQAMEISWSHFDVEAHHTGGCSYDYIEFFDGNGNVFFKKFCGNTWPPTLTISTSTASVVFHSDGSVRKKGFKFCYEPGVPLQYLSSPNYPRNYPNKQNTSQTISVENGAAIRVTFHDFQIEDHYSCGYDYVQFCDGNVTKCDVDLHLSHRMCGRAQPKDFTIQTTKATVVFHSDHSVTPRGFLLSYRAVCTPGAVNSDYCFCEDTASGSGVVCVGGERCNKDGTCQPADHVDCKGKCPENAGCFNDELGDYGPIGAHGFCHCYLGFYTDNSTDPPTCRDMRGGGNCDQNGNSHICYQTEISQKHWEWCPYCSVKKQHEDHGEDLSLGYYVSGQGDLGANDPQVFTNGDDEDCDGRPRQTNAFWYCWYDQFPEGIVPLDSMHLEWSEPVNCEYLVYAYTPLACCFANPDVLDPASECGTGWIQPLNVAMVGYI